MFRPSTHVGFLVCLIGIFLSCMSSFPNNALFIALAHATFTVGCIITIISICAEYKEGREARKEKEAREAEEKN